MEGNFIQISNHGESINFISSFSGEASGISPQAFYRGCGEPGVPAGQGLTCTVEELFDVRLPSTSSDIVIIISSFCYHATLPVFLSVQGGCTVEELFDVRFPSMNIVISFFRYHAPLPGFSLSLGCLQVKG